jgi:hypothetical protein
MVVFVMKPLMYIISAYYKILDTTKYTDFVSIISIVLLNINNELNSHRYVTTK